MVKGEAEEGRCGRSKGKMMGRGWGVGEGGMKPEGRGGGREGGREGKGQGGPNVLARLRGNQTADYGPMGLSPSYTDPMRLNLGPYGSGSAIQTLWLIHIP